MIKYKTFLTEHLKKEEYCGKEKLMAVKDIKEYEIIKQYYMEDLNSQAYLLKHKKTGARIALLSNDDNNKVFNIGFRTIDLKSTHNFKKITVYKVLFHEISLPLCRIEETLSKTY